MITPRYSDDVSHICIWLKWDVQIIYTFTLEFFTYNLYMHVDGISLQNGPQHSTRAGCKFLLSVHLKNLDYVVFVFEHFRLSTSFG